MHRLIILTCQDVSSGRIFEQLENAKALSKLLVAVVEQLRNLRSAKRIEYAASLSPLSRVLVMLVRTHEDEAQRAAVREAACAILGKYRDVPCGQSEDVAQVVGNALCVLELLVLRGGNLSFSAETSAIAAAPSEAELGALRALLNDLWSDPVFCGAIRSILGQPECALGTAGQVCSLLRCLFLADSLCFDAATNPNPNPSRAVEKIFSSSSSSSSPSPGLPDLLRLLEREVLALPDRDPEERVSAPLYLHLQLHPRPPLHGHGRGRGPSLHRLCSIAGTLRRALPLLSPAAADAAMDADDRLCRSLAALEQWLERATAEGLRGNTEKDAETRTETERLLRVLVEDFAAMLEGTHDALWPRSIAAVASLTGKVTAATGHGALLHTATAAGTAAEKEKGALLLEMDSLRAQIAVLQALSAQVRVI